MSHDKLLAAYGDSILGVLQGGMWYTMHEIRAALNNSRMNPDPLLAAVRVLEKRGKVETIDGWIKPPFRVRKVDTTTARVQSAATPNTAGNH